MAEVAENTPPLPPQAPLPSYYVIKNGLLIVRKKALRNGFCGLLRMSENVPAESPWDGGDEVIR